MYSNLGSTFNGTAAPVNTGSILIPDGRVILTPNTGTSTSIVNPYNYTISLAAAIPAGFQGSVVISDGRVIFIPFTSTTIGILRVNDVTIAYTQGPTHNVPSPCFSGGTLDPNGNVVMIPYSTSSNIGNYNPQLNTYSNIKGTAVADGAFTGGVLLPNGNIVCVPFTNANICQYSPFSQAISNAGTVGASGTAKFRGGVLAPNGNVILVPSSGTGTSNIGVYNPATRVYYNVQTNTGLSAFNGGCLLPSGNIVFAPFQSANVGMFDPGSLTYSNSTQWGPTGLQAFAGATLVPDGRVIFCSSGVANVGIFQTRTPAPPEFCQSPYFNKY
jgi:hypothetical protein